MNKIVNVKTLRSVPSAQKVFSLVAIAALVITPFIQGNIAQGAADKIDICHKTGPNWNFMQTPSDEASGHFGHGDFLYEGPEGSKPEKDQWCADNAPSEEPETSTVTICKYDDTQNPLEGWSVFIEQGDNQYGGTTGADGCVEASDVPFGDYTLGEDLEDGWENVEGDGESVSVDEETETFSLVNRELAACEDGLDNDDDGQTDFDNDPGCSSPSDDDETDPAPGMGTLIVQKVVINNDGGTAATSSFSFTVNGNSTTTFNSDGENELSLALGTYTIVEVPAAGYTTTYEGCTNVEVNASTTSTCTITNDDIDEGGGGEEVATGTITIIKESTPEDGTDFLFTINGQEFSLDDGGDEDGVSHQETFERAPGSYTVEEDLKDGWVLADVSCNEGATVSRDPGEYDIEITLGEGEDVTCTFTNRAVEPGEFLLTLDLTGEGNGKVLGDGIDCDSNAEETDCAQTYASGTVVELTVTPDDDSTFDESWTVGAGTCTGNNSPCSVTMNGNLNLVAHFGVAQSSGGGGRVRSGGGDGDDGGEVLGATDVIPQVLGVTQVAQVPTGAPNTGAGGSELGGLVGTLMTILGAIGAVRFRKT